MYFQRMKITKESKKSLPGNDSRGVFYESKVELVYNGDYTFPTVFLMFLIDWLCCWLFRKIDD